MADKIIRFNGFKQATVSHAAVGVWRHEGNQSHRYNALDYWVETAKTLEAGLFDGLFVADVLGVLDTHGGRIDETLKQGAQTPSIDPLLAVSAMAAVTKHLGFAITVSTTYEQPYLLARKLTSLDHLSGGRIGWNVVTSALESAARNLGYDSQTPHDERYAIAEEFLEVAYKLWEGSWEDDAVVLDRANGVFADPAKVHAIGHKGRYFSVPDAFIAEPSPQRTPLLFQAGSSSIGKDFAAHHAEGIFISVHKPEIARRIVDDIRQRAERFGRDPASVKIFAMATVVTGPDDVSAQALHRALSATVSTEGHLARLSAILQLDLSQLDPDVPLEYVATAGIQGVLEMYTKLDPERRWTPRAIGEFLGIAGGGAEFVGSGNTVADEIEAWVDASGIDGFNITDPMPLRSFADFGTFVLPELRRRGRARTHYEGKTYRESLYGAGQPRLRSDHPGRAFRYSTTGDDA
ncbi:5,10-methylene tetrahydromethanopterin reductase [Devosia epidermidihirudinis]|uniref:5,10-methylene tetrahydromethanopterin reductase n=1 Tax=Devosia epidermidihirudinis TaxID=1293439 RepID=A0A0F5QB73_9HYPH|nr:LLM class flavin-dependent oxidoreductase [Devosia epidermidihirudinis]KKC37978.1 5,10-methylene tetrahydromethanopterin reductase [Devosia epidermidihirudinis]